MDDILQIKSDGNDIVISGATNKILGNKFAKMYLRRNLVHTIEGNTIRVKDVSDIDKVMKHLSALAEYGKCKIEYDSLITCDIQDYKKREQLFMDFSKKANDIRNNHPVISDFKEFEESLISNMRNRKLYELQMLSAYHMAFSQNACNFSVPGAGKTSVVYGAYAYLKNLPKDNPKHVDKLLIIGPLSSFGPWESEYKECFGRDVESTRLISKFSKEQKSVYLHSLDTTELTITSYQSVISLKDDLKFFVAHNKVMVVLDEAHKIKNTQGAITAASTLELAMNATSRIVLTGTPAPNGYEDLYNLYKFIWPDRDVISYNVAQLKDMSKTINDSRVPDLINRISPFFIRVRKSDLNIPPAEFETVPVTMSDSQRMIYDIIEQHMMSSMDDSEESPYIQRMRQAKLIRLLQVATNPVLINQPLSDMFDESGDFIQESEEDRLFIENVRQFIQEEIPQKFIRAGVIARDIISNGGKVVIWANFIKNIEMMGEYLNSLGIASRILYGATPVDSGNEEEDNSLTREAIVKEFNSDESSFNVIIANPFAVAESISLHKKCHNAIYLERSFNAAHFIQSKDRIHRYGLSPDIITRYYYLVSEQSIDETVDTRLRIKEDRLNQIMESMPIPLFDNTLKDGGIEDIKAILRDYAKRAKKI